jgi:hypothetical protein
MASLRTDAKDLLREMVAIPYLTIKTFIFRSAALRCTGDSDGCGQHAEPV